MVIALAGSSSPQTQSLAPAPPEIYCKYFIYGYPLGAPASNDLIIRDLYAPNSNGTTKFADWVCCLLTCHVIAGDLDLERNLRTDPWLGSGKTIETKPRALDDHGGRNEYDRGRLALLAPFKALGSHPCFWETGDLYRQ